MASNPGHLLKSFLLYRFFTILPICFRQMLSILLLTMNIFFGDKNIDFSIEDQQGITGKNMTFSFIFSCFHHRQTHKYVKNYFVPLFKLSIISLFFSIALFFKKYGRYVYFYKMWIIVFFSFSSYELISEHISIWFLPQNEQNPCSSTLCFFSGWNQIVAPRLMYLLICQWLKVDVTDHFFLFFFCELWKKQK